MHIDCHIPRVFGVSHMDKKELKEIAIMIKNKTHNIVKTEVIRLFFSRTDVCSFLKSINVAKEGIEIQQLLKKNYIHNSNVRD